MRIILIRIMAFVSDKTQGNLDAAENGPPTAHSGASAGGGSADQADQAAISF
jgi:hypothetical protein